MNKYTGKYAGECDCETCDVALPTRPKSKLSPTKDECMDVIKHLANQMETVTTYYSETGNHENVVKRMKNILGLYVNQTDRWLKEHGLERKKNS
jgi:outer membrane protein assembly factor BamD (BamD/ComL family)